MAGDGSDAVMSTAVGSSVRRGAAAAVDSQGGRARGLGPVDEWEPSRRRSTSTEHPTTNRETREKAAMSDFGFSTTTDEVLDGRDLTGVNVVITGTSAGLGVETARALRAHGATVVGVVRNVEKARGALAAAGVNGVDLYEADLTSLASIRAFTDTFLADGHDRIDVLIANAGIMAVATREETSDGFEMQFGTNHLGHFVLVNRF